MRLHVVMTNTPGPGAAALLRQSLRGIFAPGVLPKGAADAMADVVNDGASEFVELENQDGASVGPASGATWSTRDDGYAVLGPFAPAADGDILDRLAEMHDADMRIGELHDVLIGYLERSGRVAS